jgi:hypothetical protein
MKGILYCESRSYTVTLPPQHFLIIHLPSAGTHTDSYTNTDSLERIESSSLVLLIRKILLELSPNTLSAPVFLSPIIKNEDIVSLLFYSLFMRVES